MALAGKDLDDEDATSTVDSDAQALRSIALGYRLSQALYVFAELRIADLLASGPACATDLAEASGACRPALVRLLRTCRQLRLVDTVGEDDTYRLTARGHLLRTEIPGSSWPRVRAVGDHWHWGSWGRLLDAVRTGRSAFESEHGFNSFDFFNSTPGTGDAMMSRVTVEATLRGAAIAELVDFGAIGTIADVGGGRGAVLGEILARHPHLRGVLFDLPYAVAGSAEVLDGYGVRDRCDIVAGDFRACVPAGAEAYLLAAVLHSWDDDDAVLILRRCLAQAPSTVLVLDEVVEPATASLEALLKDLQLMVFSAGRHRGQADYQQLFDRAGARLERARPVGQQELLWELSPAGTVAP